MPRKLTGHIPDRKLFADNDAAAANSEIIPKTAKKRAADRSLFFTGLMTLSAIGFILTDFLRVMIPYQPPPPPPPPPPPELPPPPLPDDEPGGVEAEEMADEKLLPIVEVKFEGEKAAAPKPVPVYQAGL